MSIRKLYLELTDRCNLNCTICYRQSWDAVPCDMEQSLYAKLLAETREIPSLETVVLGGIGEPTCSPDFFRALEDYEKYRIILTSNAAFQNDDILKAIAEGVDTVVLSIDGLQEAFFNIRGISLDIPKTNITQLVQWKHDRKSVLPRVFLQCVLSTDNVGDALALVDLAGNLHVDGLIFSNLIPQVSGNKDKILYKRVVNPEMKELFNRLRIRSFHKGIQLTLPHMELKTERFCSFIEDDSVFVSAAGNVIPCYRFSHNYTEYVFGREKQVNFHGFGNVSVQSLMEIWSSHPYALYRDRVRNGRYPSCPDCDLVDGCDYVSTSEADCWCNTPACADCLWSRNIIICP
jgi:tungsten cofactor oxidoreducase radical SAM maturase